MSAIPMLSVTTERCGPIVTLTFSQWVALRDYGFCTITRDQYSQVGRHLKEKTLFDVHQHGHAEDFVVRVVAEQVINDGAGEIFILQRVE